MARTKGSKNKRSFDAEELALRFDVDPLEVLLMIAAGDWKSLGFEEKSRTSFTPQGIEILEDNVPLSQRCQAAKEAAKYLYAAKQSVAISTGDSGIKIIVEDYSKAKT